MREFETSQKEESRAKTAEYVQFYSSISLKSHISSSNRVVSFNDKTFWKRYTPRKCS